VKLVVNKATAYSVIILIDSGFYYFYYYFLVGGILVDKYVVNSKNGKFKMITLINNFFLKKNSYIYVMAQWYS
jgi:hypothetical protein